MTRRNLIGRGVRMMASLPLLGIAAKVAEGMPVTHTQETKVLCSGDSLDDALSAARNGDTIYVCHRAYTIYATRDFIPVLSTESKEG